MASKSPESPPQVPKPARGPAPVVIRRHPLPGKGRGSRRELVLLSACIVVSVVFHIVLVLVVTFLPVFVQTSAAETATAETSVIETKVEEETPKQPDLENDEL